MYRCESWTLKKAEHQRIDAFKLCCWRRLLRVPWTARSNQSILKEISPEYSLEELMLKLKLQYFGHLMRRTDSFKKSLMLGKIEGGSRKGWQRMRWLDGNIISVDMSLSKLQGSLACCTPLGHKESDMTEKLPLYSNWNIAPLGLKPTIFWTGTYTISSPGYQALGLGLKLHVSTFGSPVHQLLILGLYPL